MLSKKEWIAFAAGALTLHTVSHIVLAYSNVLPITIMSITLTPQLNMYAIIVSAVLTLAAFWWLSKTR